ncbi:MAG: hypothetical protein AAB368_10610 [bacterium]
MVAVGASRAWDAAGAFLDSPQQEVEASGLLEGGYPLADWLTATAGVTVREARSNMKEDRGRGDLAAAPPAMHGTLQ